MAAAAAHGSAAAHGLGAGAASLLRDDASAELEVFLAAADLPRLDVRSESDPFAILYVKGGTDTEFREVGRTNVAKDDPNPKWTTAFSFRYQFEDLQTLLVKVWDADGDRDTGIARGGHDYIGAGSTLVGELMGIDGGVPGRTSVQLRDDAGRPRGIVKLFAEEKVHSSEHLVFQFSGKKLANKDGFFGRSDPYFVINRAREDGSWVGVHKSEVVINDLNPSWQRQTVSMQKLCAGDRNRPLRIEIWDYDKTGGHDYMGSCEFNAATILSAARQGGANNTFPIIEEEKKRKKGKRYKGSGALTIVAAELISIPSFMDYLVGGMELSMMVAIDFTASNGEVNQPRSLHYLGGAGQPNQYEKAIKAVGDILEPYDADRQFPVFGFGGRAGPGQPVSHAFRLVPSADVSEVQGVDGILGVYRNALQQVGLGGPTVFASVINEATAQAAGFQTMEQERLQYLVLLIITDGVINDMQNTIDSIVEASALPLSIIIVGVGTADFAQMEELDGDDQALRSRSGREAARDIVQFVPFRDFTGL